MHLCVHLLLSKKKRIATGCLSLHKHLKAMGNFRIIDAQSSGQAKSERIRFQLCHGWQNLKARFIPVRAKEPLPHRQLSFPKVKKRAASHGSLVWPVSKRRPNSAKFIDKANR
jgi:hypothetical protein